MYILQKSTDKKKKYQITTPSGKKIYFGATGYSDYTRHKDKTRRAAYIARHAATEDWTDPSTAGFWSRWLLWGFYTDFASNAKYIKNKFGITIKI